MASDQRKGRWDIVYKREVKIWLRTLNEKDRARVDAAIEQLTVDGPNLPAQRAKLIKSSRHHNMKELRSVGKHMRLLFAFDPRGRAVLLIGGDKAGDWAGWYRRNVGRADKIYDKHLRSLGKEGPWAATVRISRDRSAGAER